MTNERSASRPRLAVAMSVLGASISSRTPIEIGLLRLRDQARSAVNNFLVLPLACLGKRQLS